MLEIHLWLFEKSATFPKKQRFVLGQQIENSSLNCMRYIIEANNERSAEITIAKLDCLNVELEVLARSFVAATGTTARTLGF